MRTYKEVVETLTLQKVDKYLCDWCGKEIEDSDSSHNTTSTIEYLNVYSDYGDAWTELDSWKVDLCIACMDKIKTFLFNNSVLIQELG